jgi:hypothetical protein
MADKLVNITQTKTSYRILGSGDVRIYKKSGLVVMMGSIKGAIIGDNVKGLVAEGKNPENLFLVWQRGSLEEKTYLGRIDSNSEKLVNEINEIYVRRSSD